MKHLKKLAALLVCLVLVYALCAPVMGAEDYTYTVRIYAGNRGTVDGGDVIVIPDQPYGTEIVFDTSRIQPTDEKYYVKGIRESGKDNNTVSAPRIVVTQDVDYVAAYGIRGETVTLTVNYVERDTGRQLASSKNYYGNVGDKPIVPYLYIDGYQPQAYNITGTLTEGTNVWTFEYSPIVVVTPTPAPTATPAPAQNTPAAENTPVPAENTPAAAQNTPAPAQNTPAENNGPETNNTIPATQNTPAPAQNTPAPAQDTPAPAANTPSEPEEILDIDAPRSEFGGTAAPADTQEPSDTTEPEQTPGPEDGRGLSTGGIVGIVAAAVAVAAAIIGIFMKKRKKDTIV